MRNSTNNARSRRAYRIAERYVGNITKQRDYQNSTKAMYKAYANRDFAEAERRMHEASDRQYTKRVYMQGQSVG